MSRFFTLTLILFGIFVAYHYYPEATKNAGSRLVDKTVRATSELFK